MYKGIYIALSGAMLNQTNMELVSQNISNADTTGYKKDSVSFRDYLIPQDVVSPKPDGRVMSTLSTFRTDLSDGNFIKTSAPFDVAVEGSGFIALEGNGYTRRGDLKRNGEGFLTTSSGKRVLGQKGPIRLPEGTVEITDTGEISVNGLPVDTIKIVDFAKKESLTKRGDGIFTTEEPGTKSKASVKQGYLETSNIETIKEMVKMIETLRDYQTYQKAIQTFDDASAKANEMGRF